MAADKDKQIEVLKKGNLEVKGQFLFGSNYSFLVSMEFEGTQVEAVYKPMKGELPLWDFPSDTLADREVAAYIISEALAWDLVPPTVIRRNAQFGKGSLQVFIAHNPEENYFTFDKKIHENLRPTALFDLIINNADRKGSHILQEKKGGIKLIDHGLCFHIDPKLRTVVWDFGGQSVPQLLLDQIEQLRQNIEEQNETYTRLQKHLSKAEITAITRRIQVIMDNPVFPSPDLNRRPFPWPLV